MEVDDDTGEVVAGRQVRPFADWMLEQRQGALANELGDGLNELVDAVKTHGKPGKIVLTVTIKPATKTGHDTVLVSDDITVKLPTEQFESVYFITADANLSRENPASPRLPLREVPKAPAATEKKTKEAK